jgi:hypothetical protein
MSNKKLESIVGLRVVDAILTIGDAGIRFENGASLAIYNEFSLTGFSQNEERLLINNLVTRINDSGNKISIFFEKELSIEIDMHEESYTSPEAMQLRIPGEPIIIWN